MLLALKKATRRYAGVSHIDVDGMTEESAKKYVDYAKAKGVEIAALAYFPNPLSDDEETAEKSRAHLYKVIDAAALMDVNLVTTFIGKEQDQNRRRKPGAYGRNLAADPEACEGKGRQDRDRKLSDVLYKG